MNPPEDFEAHHEPVLLKEVLHYLSPKPGMTIYDLNLGYGGHAYDILKQLRGEGLLVGFDIDPTAVEMACRRMQDARIVPTEYKFSVGNHADLAHLLAPTQIPPPGGILLDLGVSTPQLRQLDLGLSWEHDGPLEMRLDPQNGMPSAGEIVNEWDEEEMTRLFREYGEEKWSGRIAKRIVEARKRGIIATGRELGQIVADSIPRKAWPPKIHPATRVFLALRIYVNREYENLEKVLPQAFDLLLPGGRLVVISFHGGEDGRVKRFFQTLARPESEAPWPLPQRGKTAEPRLKILTPRPIWASEEEVKRNPKSRSARLRAAEKVY